MHAAPSHKRQGPGSQVHPLGLKNLVLKPQARAAGPRLQAAGPACGSLAPSPGPRGGLRCGDQYFFLSFVRPVHPSQAWVTLRFAAKQKPLPRRASVNKSQSLQLWASILCAWPLETSHIDPRDDDSSAATPRTRGSRARGPMLQMTLQTRPTLKSGPKPPTWPRAPGPGRRHQGPWLGPHASGSRQQA